MKRTKSLFPPPLFCIRGGSLPPLPLVHPPHSHHPSWAQPPSSSARFHNAASTQGFKSGSCPSRRRGLRPRCPYFSTNLWSSFIPKIRRPRPVLQHPRVLVHLRRTHRLLSVPPRFLPGSAASQTELSGSAPLPVVPYSWSWGHAGFGGLLSFPRRRGEGKEQAPPSFEVWFSLSRMGRFGMNRFTPRLRTTYLPLEITRHCFCCCCCETG